MTAHLPECLTPNDGYEFGICICDRLRAHEARVREENDRHWRLKWLRDTATVRNAALDAARGVVLENATAHERLELPWYAEVLRAVASQIDALRGAE